MTKAPSLFERMHEHVFTKATLLIVALLGGVITVLGFFQNQNPQLQFEIVSNSNVLDINADISKLDILYDSTSLKAQNNNLRIMTVRVVNRGNAAITISSFDTKDPVGLRIEAGTIIDKPEKIEWSNDYLKNNISIEKASNEKIEIESFILEENEYFVIKFLVLHKQTVNPKLLPTGKIANQKELSIVNEMQQGSKSTNYFHSAFSGSFTIQLGRLFGYFLLAIAIIVAVVLLTNWASKTATSRQRRRIVEGFKDTNSYPLTKMDDRIFEEFIESGPETILQMAKLTSDPDLLATAYRKNKNSQHRTPLTRSSINSQSEFSTNLDLELRSVLEVQSDTIEKLLQNGIVIKQGESFIINETMKTTLHDFIFYLVGCNQLTKKDIEGWKYEGSMATQHNEQVS